MSSVASAALSALREADLEILGLLPGASNGTFLARAGEHETLVVYKPRSGETPLWDFPDRTLWAREVAAYELAAALGWPDVPPTVLGEGPLGPGAVQLFVPHDAAHHYFTLREGRQGEFARVAAFDVIVNNADRKAGHCLLGDEGRIWLIDHGVCFHVEPKLRTVVWDFAGDPLGPDLARDVAVAAEALRSAPLRARLADLLTDGEVEAAARRVEDLARGGRFPVPGPWRHVPWPPI